jgi:hypothetical protein
VEFNRKTDGRGPLARGLRKFPTSDAIASEVCRWCARTSQIVELIGLAVAAYATGALCVSALERVVVGALAARAVNVALDVVFHVDLFRAEHLPIVGLVLP